MLRQRGGWVPYPDGSFRKGFPHTKNCLCWSLERIQEKSGGVQGMIYQSARDAKQNTTD